MATVGDSVAELGALARSGGRKGRARFGINADRALGVRIPDLRGLARHIGTDHHLALALWKTGMHEARILACLIDDRERVTEAQVERYPSLRRAAIEAADRIPGRGTRAARWAASDALRERR